MANFSRVFVLCSGRCGSVTLSKALACADNFTVGHESNMAVAGPERLHYPTQHIEIDNRLTFMLGRLHARYGDEPLYVHLMREPAACAASYAKRFHPGLLLFAWARGIHVGMPDELDLAMLARDLVDNMNQNIALFLADRPHVARVRVEHFGADVAALWAQMGAEGNLQAALASLSTHHNTGLPELPGTDPAGPGPQ